MKWLILMALSVCAFSTGFKAEDFEPDLTITLPEAPKDGDLFRYRHYGNYGLYERYTNKVETVTNTQTATIYVPDYITSTTNAHPFKLLQEETTIWTNALWTIDGRTYPTVVTWSLDDSFKHEVVIRTNSVVVTRTNLVLQVEHDGKTNYITLKEGK